MRHRWMVLACGGVAVALLAASGAAFMYGRPTRLSIAVSEADPQDAALIDAASKLVKFGKRAVRLKLIPVPDASAAAAAVDDDAADLAVVRTDVAMPKSGQTVVILHRDAVILLAPASGDVKDVADLRNRKIGIVGGGLGNRRLLDTVLAHYGIDHDAFTTENLAPESVGPAIAGKTVEAILAVDVVPSRMLSAVVEAVATAGGGAPVFVPIEDADAIAQAGPAFDSTKILRGAFGGATPQPPDEIETLGVTHRLVANESVDQDAVSELTRFILDKRAQLAAVAPIAQRIEAPSTDKGGAYPVHAGAAAFIDDEEQTFFDKYSDMIYIGAMLLGVLASGATAVWSRINTRKTEALDGSVGRLVAMLGKVRTAPMPPLLDQLQSEADGILAQVIEGGGASDERRFAVFSLALGQVHAAISDRRQALAHGAGAPAREATFARALAGE